MKWLRDRFYYALSGIFYALRKDSSIQMQFIIGIVVLIAGILLRLSKSEWIQVIFCVFLVWISEFFNSCIEMLVDHISLDFSMRAKHIKDMAAGAVLLASIYAFIVGCMIFAPKLF